LNARVKLINRVNVIFLNAFIRSQLKEDAV